jgi:hypothetical protein
MSDAASQPRTRRSNYQGDASSGHAPVQESQMPAIKTRFLYIATSLFASIGCLLIPTQACAAQPFIVSGSREIGLSLRPFIDVYEDRSGQLELDQLLQLEHNNPHLFLPAEQARPAAVYSYSAWWMRVEIENQTDGPQQLVLIAGRPNLENADFYLLQNDTWRHTRAGSFVPAQEQQDLTRYPTLRFALQPGEYVRIWIRIKSHAPFRLDPALYSHQTFRAAAMAAVVSDGMLIGGIGALAWCTFLLAAVGRRRPFLWLGAIAGTAALREAAARGYIQRVFWPLDSPWSYRLELSLDTLCLALLAIFIHSVAQRSTVTVPGSRAYAVIAATLLVCALLTAFLPVYATTMFGLVGGIAVAACMLVSALVLVRRSHAIGALLGLSAILVGVEIVLKIMGSPRGAPMVPESMVLASGTSLITLLVIGANLAVLSLWAVRSLNGAWRGSPRHPLPPDAQQGIPSGMPQTSSASVPSQGLPGTPPDLSTDKPRRPAPQSPDYDSRQALILGYVGHDLRAPLATISGYARLLRQAAAPAQHAHLDAIERSVTYQFSLIDEILAYAESELQPFSITPAETRLPELLEELARFGIALCVHHGNRFQYLPVPTLPAVVTLDPKRLRQAVLNLLGNAAKFSRQGTVRFEANMHWGGQTHTELHLHVVNDGPDIPLENQTEIFDAFRQLHHREAGAGLGLFIVERIIHGMGGDVRLDSSPDSGNRFTLIVPVNVVDATAVATRAIHYAPAREAVAGRLNAPPLPERLALSKLARDGELSEIEKWVAETRAANPGHEDFYNEVMACVETFDMDRLQRLVLLGVA